MPTDVPPHEPLYQYQSAVVPKTPPVRFKVVELPWQIVDKTAATEIVEVEELSFTVIIVLMHIEVLQIPSALT